VAKAARVRSIGHVQTETRTIRMIGLAGSSDGHDQFFLGARQALKMIRARRDRHGRLRLQTDYAITSLNARHADLALLGHLGARTGASRPACTG